MLPTQGYIMLRIVVFSPTFVYSHSMYVLCDMMSELLLQANEIAIMLSGMVSAKFVSLLGLAE
jgi:hypothetical protein